MQERREVQGGGGKEERRHSAPAMQGRRPAGGRQDGRRRGRQDSIAARRGAAAPRPRTESSREDPRAVALAVLMDILEDGRFSHLALRETLRKYPSMPERDRAFLTRLCEGTIELSIQLDYLLNDYSKIKVKKMKPLIRNILRIGAYQILYMDRVPDSAAVNESVKLCKKRGLSGLSAYVNAVLRSIEREKAQIFERLRNEEETPLFIRYSLPEWLFEYLVLCYGRGETIRMGEYFLSEENRSFVRYRDGHSAQLGGNLSERADFKSGEMTVQDYSSQQVGLLADPKPGDLVVDLCAAPGGKACHIAELLKGSGEVSARDLSKEKTVLIEENRRRLRLTNLKTKVWDARIRDESLLTPDGEGRADIVLCDLPCSGLGILKKKPDIRYSASLDGIRGLQALQREILTVAKDYVRRGGRLLYSTCTLTREENEQNRDFIERELGLRLLREQKLLPGQPSDGFYIAEFKKE